MYPFPPPPQMLQRSFAWWSGNPIGIDFVAKTVAMCETLPTKKAEIGGGEAYNELVNKRDSAIAWVPFPGENPELDTSWLYKEIAAVLIKLNEDWFRFHIWGFIDRLQYTVYDASKGEQHYGWHVDTTPPQLPQRKLSFSLLLTDPMEYEGGDLKIAGTAPQVMKKDLGMMLVFPSYTGHKVTPVTKGIRRSLVGWVSGWDFR